MEVENVIFVICNRYDLAFWKIVFLWAESHLGNHKIFGDNCAAALGIDHNGCQRNVLHSLYHIDCRRHCGSYWQTLENAHYKRSKGKDYSSYLCYNLFMKRMV